MLLLDQNNNRLRQQPRLMWSNLPKEVDNRCSELPFGPVIEVAAMLLNKMQWDSHRKLETIKKQLNNSTSLTLLKIKTSRQMEIFNSIVRLTTINPRSLKTSSATFCLVALKSRLINRCTHIINAPWLSRWRDQELCKWQLTRIILSRTRDSPKM